MTAESYFLLALFICALTAAVLYLYDRLKRARTRDEIGSIKDKELRLYKLYQNLEDMIGSMEEYVEETKTDFHTEREEIEALFRRMAALSEGQPLAEEQIRQTAASLSHTRVQAKPVQWEPPAVISARKPESGKKSGKVENVRRLAREGKNEEAIAKELRMSHGEVTLILGMLGDDIS